MRAALVLRAGHRTPLIKFIGKRSAPKAVDHTPQAHPASPTHSLPDSFASYRSKIQSHGPLGNQEPRTSSSSASSSSEYVAPGPHPMRGSQTYGLVGGKTGAELGPIKPAEGEFFDRSELPARFRKMMAWTEEEMEAVMTGGASSILPQLSYHFKR